MNGFLLRFEGVNLEHFVYDTQDLSTIRGGGLLLLDAAPNVRAYLTGSGCIVHPIIEGASIGLFSVESAKSGEEIRRDVVEWFATHLPHATFVVDMEETGTDFPTARATLLARNRWRQMQAPSVVYPALRHVTGETEVCELDGVRPGTTIDGNAPERKRTQSDSAHARRSYGREQKQRFYANEMSRTGPVDAKWPSRYSEDFEDLCGQSGEWGNLRDKMAVIYLDGNKFGEIALRHCGTPEAQASLSKGMRDEHARVLRRLIEERIPQIGWSSGDAERVRLETLLWGGDEIVWVVPAWKGWEALQFFFSEVNANPEWKQGPNPLTYSAGLVFCHQKAPIHTITKLAKGLAERVKRKNRAEGNPYQNRLLYQVLESFDHIGEAGDEYIELVLPAAMMREISAAMPYWREGISRKKLHRILKKAPLAEEISEEIKKDLGNAGGIDKAVALAGIGALESVAGAGVWKHITELWDYVQPERSEA